MRFHPDEADEETLENARILIDKLAKAEIKNQKYANKLIDWLELSIGVLSGNRALGNWNQDYATEEHLVALMNRAVRLLRDTANHSEEDKHPKVRYCAATVPGGKPIWTVKAHRCRKYALKGSNYCYAHRNEVPNGTK